MLMHLPEDDQRGVVIFRSQLILASKLQLSTHLRVSMEMVKHRINSWKLSSNDQQDVYLLLWESLEETNKR